MAYVELFGRPKYDILADLITTQNNLTTALNSSYMTFGNISGNTVPGTEDRVSCLVVGKSPYTGQKTFSWTRIDLTKLMTNVNPTIVLPETASTVADLLPLIRVKYNLWIDEEDVANLTDYLPYIPSGSTATVTLQTKATTSYNSHVWSGNLDIVCSGGSTVPRGSLLTESGSAITTEDGTNIVVEGS